MPSIRRLAPLTLALACAEAPPTTPEDRAAEDSEADPWPDPAELPDAELSIVSEDGALLLSGATVQVETAPAGLDDPRWVNLTFTNRGDAALSFADPAAWLSGEGFAWETAPPATLLPDESARVSLVVNGLSAAEAAEWRATMTIPGLSQPFVVNLVAEVPRPLRLVVAIEGGGTLTSDDYGATWAERPPFDGAEAAQRGSLTWGDGRFLRTFADGGDWSDPGVYAASELGEDWTLAVASDEFWPSECAYGLGRFACARGDVLSWSETGGAIVHEQTSWGAMLNAIVFDGERFVAVGRDGRIVSSADGVAWDTEVTFEDGDYLYDVAYADGLWVAVGGNNRQVVLVSDDRFATWTTEILSTGSYYALGSVAENDGIWLVSGSGGSAQTLWSMADGGAWTSVPTPSWTTYDLLGVAGGWFFSTVNPRGLGGELYRSRDGVSWETVHTRADGLDLHAFAAEAR
ncbi:hypothetical protein L6R49_00215 [Myxococcota bacterium]|nr:hypothetical protein [Myxococcota bacterium]